MGRLTHPEIQDLFKDNLKLVTYYQHHYCSGYEHDEDLTQELRIALYKAIVTFDPDKSKLSTYAFRCMRNAYGMYLRIQNKRNKLNVLSLEDCISNEHDSIHIEDTVPIKSACLLYDEIMFQLSQRELKMFELKQDGLSQREIGRIMGLSQPQVARTLKHIREVIQANIIDM